MRARAAYIHIRGEYFNENVILEEATDEAYQAATSLREIFLLCQL